DAFCVRTVSRLRRQRRCGNLKVEAASRVKVALQPERGSAGEAQHHGLAARGSEPLHQSVAHQLGAVAVSEYQPRLVRNDVAWEVGRYGEIEPVAEFEIVLPFAISPVIEQAGLDLDDQHIARR